MAQIGYGQTLRDVMKKVQEWVTKLNIPNPFPEGKPTKKWYKLFMKWQPILKNEWPKLWVMNEQKYPLTIKFVGFEIYGNICREMDMNTFWMTLATFTIVMKLGSWWHQSWKGDSRKGQSTCESSWYKFIKEPNHHITHIICIRLLYTTYDSVSWCTAKNATLWWIPCNITMRHIWKLCIWLDGLRLVHVMAGKWFHEGHQVEGCDYHYYYLSMGQKATCLSMHLSSATRMTSFCMSCIPTLPI